jgi:hypothetical protein
MPRPNDAARRAVVRVGKGRGFAIKIRNQQFVLTAAHCLPRLPNVLEGPFGERTYKNLLGRLSGKPTVWAECLFVDLIGDVAVLGSPDNQRLINEAAAFDALMQCTNSLRLADAPQTTPARVLSLDGQWCLCRAEHFGGPLWLSGVVEGIRGGMSGSPIIDQKGAAIGIVCASGGAPGELHTEGGPNARLTHHLPCWLALK